MALAGNSKPARSYADVPRSSVDEEPGLLAHFGLRSIVKAAVVVLREVVALLIKSTCSSVGLSPERVR
ncbi:unnamed protein product, partial [Fusarium fujikuroi]